MLGGIIEHSIDSQYLNYLNDHHQFQKTIKLNDVSTTKAFLLSRAIVIYGRDEEDIRRRDSMWNVDFGNTRDNEMALLIFKTRCSYYLNCLSDEKRSQFRKDSINLTQMKSTG